MPMAERRSDAEEMALHLDRVCSRFPKTISAARAGDLARLLAPALSDGNEVRERTPRSSSSPRRWVG